MSNDNCFEQYQTQLEIAEVDKESDHTRLMNAYKRLNQKIDHLIETRKTVKNPSTPKP
jgi:hypothetical protein